MMQKIRYCFLALLGAGAFVACNPGRTVDLRASGACAERLEGADSAWVPTVDGLSSTHHEEGVEIRRTEMNMTIPLSGAEERPTEVEVEIPMPEDLGEEGSLMLVAETVTLPSRLEGGAYPVLLSLDDGTHELIHLSGYDRGDSLECEGEGLFCCAAGACQPNSRWRVEQPSVYRDRAQWEEHQLNPFGYLSVNTFPTCNWSSGSPECIFNNTKFFSSPRLRFGRNYRAKYALVLERYSRVPSQLHQAEGTIRLRMVRKKTASFVRSAGAGDLRGAIDLNLILVGEKNIRASRTRKGQQNLNLLTSHILSRFAAGATSSHQGLHLGALRVFEWGCQNSAEAYTELPVDQLGKLLSEGSAILPKETEGRALNLFIVSNILGAGEGFTVLGAAGAIGGPLVNGTAASGLAFASFNQLDRFNPLCGEGSCSMELQEKQFIEMGETIAHEMGHFLGLSHPSESNGLRHDALPDTPKCTKTESKSRGHYITHRSCREMDPDTLLAATGKSCLEVCPKYDGKTEFCPEATECQFNHLMWWTSKNFNGGRGDGGILSESSWKVIRYSPAVQ